MVTIHLKDGKEKQFESNVALSEAAKAISNSLGKEAVVAKVDGELTDLRDPIVDKTTVEFFTKKDPEGLFTLRHTAAHVMAQAIQHLYPGVKFAIGPAIVILTLNMSSARKTLMPLKEKWQRSARKIFRW